MSYLDKAKNKPGELGGDADLKTYNIIAYLGYVEEARVSPIIFQHIFGFDTPREAVLDLHDSVKKTLNDSNIRDEFPENYDAPFSYNGDDDDTDCGVLDFLVSLQGSKVDSLPGGYDAWELFDVTGWNYDNGELVTGVCVTIFEKAEDILSSKNEINNQFDVFEGIFVPQPGAPTFSASCSIKLEILSVAEIEKTPIETLKKA